MMTVDFDQASIIFKALAHPARLEILHLLRQGEVCVCHLETALDKRQAYISQQLAALREAGLVTTRKSGLQVYYQLAHPFVADLLALVLGEALPVPLLENCACPRCCAASSHPIKR